MPPKPSSASNEKKKSGKKKKANSTPNNDREREKDEEDDETLLANAMMAASLERNAEVTDERLAASNDADVFPTTPDIPPCDGCSKPFSGNMYCSKCESVFYCGRDCQVSHWSAGGHKKECELLQKKNEETAKRVLEQFKEIVDWKDLDVAGAYKAAVRQGLHDKIREVMELDKAEIVDRFQGKCGLVVSYTPCVMLFLFRGHRAEGRAEARSRHSPCVDGLRVRGYVRSHPDALDAWLQASVQVARAFADPIALRDPELHRLAHLSAESVWHGWYHVFQCSTAARAILTPFPSPTTKGGTDNDDGGGGEESAEQRLERGKVHARRIAKAIGEANRLVEGAVGPRRLYPNSKLQAVMHLVCGLLAVRTEAYGIDIDVAGSLNLDESQKDRFQRVTVASARLATNIKGGKLSAEDRAAMRALA